MRISLRIPCLAAIEHLVSGCACSSHISLHMLISFWWIRTLIILGNSKSHKASSKFVSKVFETRFYKVAKKSFVYYTPFGFIKQILRVEAQPVVTGWNVSS